MALNIFESRSALVGAIFAFVGAVLLSVSVYQEYQDRRFAREGRSTEGIVLRKTTRISDSRASDGVRSRTTHYEAAYRFDVEGKSFEGHDEIDKGRWDGLSEGAPVAVVYLPSGPASNRLAGERSWLLKAIFGAIGLPFAIFGAVSLVRGLRDQKLASHLREHGVKATATVLDARPMALKINDVYQWRLSYEYRDFQNQQHANTVEMPEDEARTWKAGDTAEIRYDSRRPDKSVWLGRGTSA